MLYLGRTALVTGGSSGIGLEFARIFARRGASLVLVARSESRLRESAAALEEEYGVSVRTIPADLSERESVGRIVSGVEEMGLEVSLLLNNAGSGHYGHFHEGPKPEEVWDGLSLNVSSAAALTRAFLPGMVRRREGAVVNLSSTAAFQPVPYMAAYGASKAFMLSFSEALWAECRRTGVKVLAVCPGAVQTDFWAYWGGSDPRRYNLLTGTSGPRQVAEAGARALDLDEATVIPGLRDRLVARSIPLAPRSFVARASERLNRLKRPR